MSACACACEKNMYLTAVTGKAGLWIKKYFGFGARREMIDFFVSIYNAFAQYICN